MQCIFTICTTLWGQVGNMDLAVKVVQMYWEEKHAFLLFFLYLLLSIFYAVLNPNGNNFFCN